MERLDTKGLLQFLRSRVLERQLKGGSIEYAIFKFLSVFTLVSIGSICIGLIR
jgi:hypothetical protein